LDGLDADERDICLFLLALRDQLVSEKEISRRAGGKQKFRDNPKWALHALRRLAGRGITEVDANGHYCLRLRDKERPGKKPEPEEWSCRGKKILLVDANADGGEAVTLALQDAGGEVLTARDPSDALVQQYGIKLDLIILDSDLRGGGYLELMKLLKQRQPGVSVILCTGLAQEDDTVGAMLRLGAQYLRKGSLRELWQAVGKALDQVQQ
jgi:CheY-like chemotaxis protein